MVVSLWVVWSCWCRSRAGSLTRTLRQARPSQADRGTGSGGRGARLGPGFGPLGLGGPLAAGGHPGHERAGGRGELQPLGLQQLSGQLLLGGSVRCGRRRPAAPEPADQGKRHGDGGERGDGCSPAHGGSFPLCGATGATSAQNAERLARAFVLIHAYGSYRDQPVTYGMRLMTASATPSSEGRPKKPEGTAKGPALRRSSASATCVEDVPGYLETSSMVRNRRMSVRRRRPGKRTSSAEECPRSVSDEVGSLLWHPVTAAIDDLKEGE